MCQPFQSPSGHTKYDLQLTESMRGALVSLLRDKEKHTPLSLAEDRLLYEATNTTVPMARKEVK